MEEYTEKGKIRRRSARILVVLLAVFFVSAGLVIKTPYDLFGGALEESSVYAAEPLNPDDLSIYFLEEDYVPYTGAMPAEYPTEYQIKTDGLTGTLSCYVASGSSVVVSSDGLISPKTTKWYWKGGFGSTGMMEDYDYIEIRYNPGTSVVRMTCGDYTQDITVHVTSYSNMYVENKMNSALAEIITDGMTDLEKFTAITKWVGRNTDYSVHYQSAKDMMIYECGDCWASTNTILAMCEKVGVQARSRRGNQDGGAGSGHRNVIALCEGKYYIGEAGYGGTRPRGASVYEEEGGFAVSGNTVYQYDGFDEDVVVPSVIEGKTITGFGNGKATVFPSDNCVNLYLPATITSIGDDAFYGATKLEAITIDPANESYEMVGKVLYSAGRKKLLYTLRSATEVVIDPNTEIIGREGLYGLTLDQLVIPSNVKTLELACLFNTKVNRLVIEEGLETICELALQGFSAPELVVPRSVTTYEVGPFYNTRIPKIILADTMKELPEASFWGATVVEVEIPDGVTSIGFKALANCYSLVSVSIPKSVTSIAEDAFYNSSRLSDIYYAGTEEEWNAIDNKASISDNITVHFSSVRVTGIDPGQTEILLKEKGETYSMGTKVVPANASNQKITYTSSNTSVVKVNDTTLTAQGEGTCVVTATTKDGGFKAEYQVTVRYPRYKLTIEGGKFRSGTFSGLSEGEFLKDTTVRLTTNLLYTDGYSFKNWVIPEDVTLTSGALNDTWISFNMPARDITVKAVYDEVKVYSIASLGYSGTTMCTGETMQLSPTIYPEYALNRSLAWSSDNESVMTVDETGKLTAVSAGQALITAKTTDGTEIKRTATFTVRDHRWTAENVITEANCEEPGEKEVTCSYCGLTTRVKIPAKGHTVVVDEAVPATTEAAGLTEGSHCSVCGKILVAQKVTPKLPCGWVKKGRYTYYYSKAGIPVTGVQKIDGKWYYFSARGVMQTGWIKKKGKTFYFDEMGRMVFGARKIDGKIYYFSSKGVMTVGWLTKNKKTFYFNEEGIMQTGLVKIDGKIYYFSTKGIMNRSCWLKYKSKWYYFGTDGAMVAGTKILIDGVEYTFDRKGVCLNRN